MKTGRKAMDKLKCSFCGQIVGRNRKFVISSPDATMICDRCVDLCTVLLAEYRAYQEIEDAKTKKENDSEREG